ncbi:MAG: hypothetical protein JWN70_919 [Planctomycetaceae bacterium]|nr:hypothetical protein [Planctomycetaceae bacterium]
MGGLTMFRRGFLVISASVLLLTQLSCNSGTPTSAPSAAPNTTDRDAESNLVAERLSKGGAELASLTGHGWAGRYYEGDGLGVNISIQLAPTNGAVVTWHGCLGLYDQNYGPLQEANGQIRVAWKLHHEDRLFKTDEYLAVRWGQRHYLIPTEEILEFCAAVRSDMEPRTKLHGMFPLRDGDEALPAVGSPQLPPTFEKYLLMGPIDAKLKALGELSVRTSEQDKTRDEVTQRVTLNVGAAEGVLQKMRVQVTKPRLGARVVVTQVSDHESEAVVTCWRDKGEQGALPSTEWELSTPVR